MLENFGFRVLEEIPTELQGEALSHIHDCLLELHPGISIDDVMARAATIERAIADVLGGIAENDQFNQLVLFAELDTQAGGVAARLVPLFAPDRGRLRAGDGGRCAAPARPPRPPR